MSAGAGHGLTEEAGWDRTLGIDGRISGRFHHTEGFAQPKGLMPFAAASPSELRIIGYHSCSGEAFIMCLARMVDGPPEHMSLVSFVKAMGVYPQCARFSEANQDHPSPLRYRLVRADRPADAAIFAPTV
jgi:hypothetical protein